MSQNKKNGLQLYKRLLNNTKIYKGVFFIAIIGMVVHAITDTSFAAIIKPLLDGSFIDKDPEFIGLMPLIIILIFVFRGIGSFMSSYGMAYVGRSIIRDIRKEMFNKILQRSSSLYDESITGKLVSKITFDAEQVAEAATKAITTIIKDGLTILGLLALMFYYSFELSIGLLLLAPLVGLFLKVMSIKFRTVSRDIQKSMGIITNIVEESIIGHRIIKIFGGKNYEKDTFNSANAYNRERNLRLIFIQSISIPLMQLLVAIFLALIIFFVTSNNYLEEISIGTFMSYLTAMIMMFAPIKRLSEVNVTLQRGIAASESIFDLLDSESEYIHEDDTLGIDGSISVRFDNVTFRYPSSQSNILNNISVGIKSGETVAIVGKSGSGKTTLLDLIPRLYDPNSGNIFFNDINIKDLNLNKVRTYVSYVGQDFTLFNDTIFNNIAYGELSAYDPEKVFEASKFANASDFINNFPEKFDTVVGQSGVLLSGGQRQRIAIARALLKNAPILLLDEATSALDTESEQLIQKSILKLSENKTTIIIAHRLSTVMNADNIIVINDGKIVENGKHEELIDRKSTYYMLYNSQFKS